MALPEPSTQGRRKRGANYLESDENPLEPCIKRTRKRESSNLDDDKNTSLMTRVGAWILSMGSTSTPNITRDNLETETPSPTKTKLHPREIHTASSSSSFTTESEPGEVDSSILKSSMSSEGNGNYPVSRWSYEDLTDINIFYEETPDTLDKFIKAVKDAFMKEKGFCPDISKIIDFLKKELEEMLTFSYDVIEIKNVRKVDHKEKTVKKVKQEMREIVERVNMREVPGKVLSDEKPLESALENFMRKAVIMVDSAMIDFAKETSSLIKMVLNGDRIGFSPDKKGTRKGNKDERTPGELNECRDIEQNSEHSLQKNYCELFGRIFFLLKGRIPQRTFSFHGKKLRNTADLVYHFDSGLSSEELLFIVKVIKAPIRGNVTDIRELVGENIIGQFGADLYGQSLNSVFFPNSLGVLCMETKLIFAFLKISKKHSDGIYNGERGSAGDPGMIMYTKPFDMLKAEDRSKIAEFLFWLGIVQDSLKFKLF